MSAFSFARGFQDRLAGHHHAQINDLIAITLQHDADDVLADIVDIALHRGHDDFAGRGMLLSGGLFSDSM